MFLINILVLFFDYLSLPVNILELISVIDYIVDVDL